MDIILAHRQLDFDALASMVAAQKLYHGSVIVIDGKSNPYVQDFLALAKDRLPFRKPQDINLEEVKRIVLVDTHELQRSGLGEKVARKPGVIVEIFDHHPYNGPRREGIIVEAVGACTTLLVEKIMDLGIPLSSFEATLLALGIYDDTGSLLFESTTVRDVRAVAYLLEQGANLAVVGEYLRKPLTKEQKELLQQLLDNAQIESFKGLRIFLSSASTPEYVGGLALLAHRVGEFVNAETLFLIVQMENRVYLVGRSRGRGLPVNHIVECFGGAGHEKAASASLKGARLEEVLAKLRVEIEKRVQHPHSVRDIMSYPVKTVSPDTKLTDVEKILLKYGHTGVPVVENGQLVGIISRRDVEKALKHGLEHAPVKGFMTSHVITVDVNAGWEEVHRLMIQHDIGRVPVLENGKVVGIVSRSDILRMVHGGAVELESALVRDRSLAMRQDILALLEGLPSGIRSLLEIVRDTADELGCSVFLVGGFVRDLLMRVPTQDLDFVVEGNGIHFARMLYKKLSNGELTLHSQFGTARISFPDGTHLDVASTRWEYYAYPGALPQVEESGLRDDLFRRDFTINAMAIAVNSKRFGELVDYYGGLRDLKQGEIRFLHNLSFIEDPTRILRAVRFAERYKFSLAKETRDGIYTALEAGVLNELSLERFTEEFLHILKEPEYMAMIRTLQNLGVFKEWFGQEFNWNDDLPKSDSKVDNMSYITQTVIETQPENEENMITKRWLSLISKMEEDEIHKVMARLRLTKFMSRATQKYMQVRASLKELEVKDLVMVDKLLRGVPEWFISVLMLDEDLQDTLITYQEALRNVKMKADGFVLKNLGLKEGPEIGKILGEVRAAWLRGEISSIQEEEELLRRLVSVQR